jgi:TPP-dependent indolepyruvate ferredoxin oxidoreductase alpha subunit
MAKSPGKGVHRNRVDIGCHQLGLPADLRAVGQAHQAVEDEAGTLGAVLRDQGHKGVTPFGGFSRVKIIHGRYFKQFHAE